MGLTGIRGRRRRLATAVAAAALLTCAAPAATQAHAGHPPVPKLAWEDCDDGFECATAEVPLDHERPGGRSIELALVRVRAADPDRRIGSVFIHPGGRAAPAFASYARRHRRRSRC